jgi:multidrug resistance efflux pump
MGSSRQNILLTAPRFAAVLILASFGFACSTTKSAGVRIGGNGDNSAPIAVTVGRAESRDVAAAIQATGSLTADETSDVAPRAAGKISNVSVNVGQFVSQGSVIAKIDDKDARLALASAQASVRQAIAAVRQAEARLGLSTNGTFNASAVPEVRAASANYEEFAAELRQAEANEKRYRDLVETGDVALMAYEQFRTQRDTARARLNSAKQQLDAAVNAAKQNNQAIRSAEAAVDSARAQVGVAEQALADTVIKAPFSGFVSERPVAVGEYVSSASIVATILRTNPIKIQIQIAEADVPYVSIGRGVLIAVDAYKDRSFAGTVTAVNPAIDPTSRSAFVVRINREGGSKAVFVPRSAVYNDQSTQSFRVFVVQDGTVKLRVVQLGIEEGGAVQILSGVDAEEIVATSNLEQLYEGAKVAA